MYWIVLVLTKYCMMHSCTVLWCLDVKGILECAWQHHKDTKLAACRSNAQWCAQPEARAATHSKWILSWFSKNNSHHPVMDFLISLNFGELSIPHVQNNQWASLTDFFNNVHRIILFLLYFELEFAEFVSSIYRFLTQNWHYESVFFLFFLVYWCVCLRVCRQPSTLLLTEKLFFLVCYNHRVLGKIIFCGPAPVFQKPGFLFTCTPLF